MVSKRPALFARNCLNLGVVIVSQNDPAVLSRQAQKIGAAGWVAKNSLASDLIPAIQETIAGRNRVRAGVPDSPQRQEKWDEP
jgi:DNA-binding NarL/FixJ family response regulator